MADQKLSQLTSAATPTGGELVYVVQNGVQRRTTTQAVADLANAAITAAIDTHDDEADPHNGASPTFADLAVAGLLTAPHIHGSLAGDIYLHVKNASGGSLAANTAVYATGSVGDTDRIEVDACDPTDPAKMPAIGLLTTTLANNGTGDAIILGELRPTNTGGYTLGDELYVGAGGALVNTIPASGTVQRVGSVARVQAETGTIVVGIGAGMSRVGFTGAYDDLGSKPTLGTAAAQDVGTDPGDVVQLDGSGRLPAVDGSQLTNLPSAGGTPGGADTELQYNDGGSFAGLSTFTTDGTNLTLSGQWTSTLNGAASAPPVSLTGTWFSGGTGTTTKPQFLIEPTGTTSASWDINGTGLGVNAPSGFTGNLLDLQVGGVNKAKITSAGYFYLDNYQIRRGTLGILEFWGHLAASRFNVDNVSERTVGTKLWQYAWSSGEGAVSSTVDLLISRDAAGTLAQRNGTNAQTFRVYNTYTDPSNYERGFLQWNSGVFEIGTEGAGTGSEQPLRITAATLNIPNLPEYADDSAAGTGGLVAGDVYKTSTGELRIKL